MNTEPFDENKLEHSESPYAEADVQRFGLPSDVESGMEAETTEQKFARLTDEWRRETRKLSIAHKVVFHQAYQQIIGMGPVVLPLIFQEFQTHDEDWFWALMMITGENLFQKEQSYRDAKEAWLKWGQERGFLTRNP